MTQDDVIKMARQSGAVSGKPTPDSPEIVFTQCLDIYHFAKLVAAKEREACAVIAEKQRYAMHISLTSNPLQNGTAVGIANAIRARGQA